MFWGPGKLSRELSKGRITPFLGNRVDGASYRLSIGDEVYVSPTAQSADKTTQSTWQLKQRESFCIPPGQFAFILTLEKIRVELNEIAFISLRAKTKYRGLVNVSGFHVDPGFEGRLIFAVFNAGPDPIHLKQGEDIFLIWFSDLTDSCQQYRDPGPDELPSDLVNGISGNLYSLAGLAQEFEEVKSKMESLRNIAFILITLAGGLLLTLVGILVRMFVMSLPAS